MAVEHPDTVHRVENHARKSYLYLLASHGDASADDRLVSTDLVLKHAALAVARPLVQLASTASLRIEWMFRFLSFNVADGLGLSRASRPCGMSTLTVRPSPCA